MDTDRRRDEQVHLQRFGQRLRLLRQERNISQERLAEDAGLHRAVVGFIERGERDVGISHLWPLARALDVDVRDLFPAVRDADSGARADS